MERLKKMIIILVILIIIICIAILILNKKLQSNEQIDEGISEEDTSEDFIKSIGIVEDYRTFFSVEKMLNNYIVKVHYKNEDAVYNFLDKDYIEENSITKENISNYISDISQYDTKAKIRKMYSQENEENAVYYIDCILEKEHKGEQFYFALYKDEQNLTYSVEPLDKENFEKQIKEESQELERKQIEKNEYNAIVSVNPTEEEIVKKYFEDFLENALYYPEYTYNLLNNGYKNKCFPMLQDFKDYIEDKRDIFLSYDMTTLKQYGEFENMDEYLLYLTTANNLELEKYQIRQEEEYNKYVCIDSEGNYYTFYATSPLNYTVVLGNYAIPTEEFIEEYNSSTDVQKVLLNIKRFFMGIDDKNYGYAYSVLSESFKNNKYPTKEEFIKYVEQNLFEENELEYVSYEKENGLYIYKIKITDATGASTEERAFNIIVKLSSGTDFEMSFGEE